VVIDRAGPAASSAARIAFAGGLAGSVLILAGNALSRATAFAATDAEFELEPNTRRLFEKEAGRSAASRRMKRKGGLRRSAGSMTVTNSPGRGASGRMESGRGIAPATLIAISSLGLP
jgi:ribosomal protein L16/L10AE